MIGNGLLNVEKNDDSLVYFSYYHGLFGRNMWHEIVRSCCVALPGALADDCHFYKFKSENCLIEVMHFHNKFQN